MPSLTRRHFFLGSFALAAACSRRVYLPKPRVSIVRAPSYATDLEDTIRRILIDHRLAIVGKRIVLKPNLVEFDPAAPINTSPIFVSAAAAAFRSLGATQVRVAEGPGHRRMTLDLAAAAGYFKAIPNFEDAFTDLNVDNVTRVLLENPHSTLTHLYLPHTVLACDLLVSLPKMKTHHWTGVTLSMKNLFGVVPGAVYGWPKNPLHWAGIDQCVADLHQLFPKQFCLVDGIEAMEGNGPILGTAKNMGVIVAGAYPPSVDTACCQLMQIDAAKIGYLNLVAHRTGWNPRLIEHIGENPAALAQRFALIPDLEHLRLHGAA